MESRGTNILAVLYDPYILVVTEDNGTISLRAFEMIGLTLTGRGTLRLSQAPTCITMSRLNGKVCGIWACGDELNIVDFSESLSISDFDQLVNGNKGEDTYLNEEMLMKSITYNMNSSLQCKFKQRKEKKSSKIRWRRG